MRLAIILLTLANLASTCAEQAGSGTEHARRSYRSPETYLPASAVALYADTTDVPWGNAPNSIATATRLNREDELPFTWTYEKYVPAATDPIWNAGLMSLPVPVPIDSGTVVHGYFYIRADFDDLQNESNTGSYEAYLQATDEGWEDLATFSGRPGPAWRQTFFTGRAKRDYPAGAVNVSLHLGTQPQRISVGGLRMFALPPETDVSALPINVLTYEGRAADAPWRAEAERRIDSLRRGDLTVRVVDAGGNPVAGETVTFELLSPAFKLGTIAHGADEFDDAADYRRWVDTTARYFDAMTCGLYPTDEWG